MSYSTFRLGANDATKEPMFLGQSVNVARYDQQKYRDFEKLIERQLSFFWRPEEVDISSDRIDFNTKLRDHERHIFLSNLRYQTLLSIQFRDVAQMQRCCRLSLFLNWKRGLKHGLSLRDYP